MRTVRSKVSSKNWEGNTKYFKQAKSINAEKEVDSNIYTNNST